MKYNNQLNQRNVNQLREEQNEAMLIYKTDIEQFDNDIDNYIASNDMAIKAINDILRYDVEKMQSSFFGTKTTAGGVTIFDTGYGYTGRSRKGYFLYSKNIFETGFIHFKPWTKTL